MARKTQKRRNYGRPRREEIDFGPEDFPEDLKGLPTRRDLRDVRVADPGPSSAAIPLSTGIALGLAFAAFAGVIVLLCWALFRRRDEREQLGFIPGVFMGQRDAELGGPQLGQNEAKVFPNTPPKPSRRSTGKTFTLPSFTVAGSRAARIATATKQPTEVLARNIGPPGSFAILAYDPAELDRLETGSGPGVIPGGDTIVINAGLWQIFRIQPGQALYAKGSVPGVGLTVAVSEFTPGTPQLPMEA